MPSVTVGCNITDWLQCAGAFYHCIETCIEYGFESAQCVECLGISGPQCFRCITDEDKDDIDQFKAAQLAREGINFMLHT